MPSESPRWFVRSKQLVQRPPLTQAVAALEHLRLALVKRQSGGPASDLTLALERAKEIGDHVERRLAAVAEVERLLE